MNKNIKQIYKIMLGGWYNKNYPATAFTTKDETDGTLYFIFMGFKLLLRSLK